MQSMGKLVDVDAVVAMLRQEAKEFATAAEVAIFASDKIKLSYTSLTYYAAADQVEQMANEQSCVVDRVANQEGKSE
jgi:hypothetical protein